jgi:hypothetical protein
MNCVKIYQANRRKIVKTLKKILIIFLFIIGVGFILVLVQPFGQKRSFFIKKYVPAMDEICTYRQKKLSDTYEGHLMAIGFVTFGLI